MDDPSPPKEIAASDTPDEHLSFMRSQWPEFAAFAWEKYLSEGRGAVVIDLKRASKNGTRFQVPTFYLADGSERLRARGGWPSDEVAQVIREYDPERDVVFIFLRLDGDAFHYDVSDEITPPKAYRSRHSRARKRK
jgi:hypothetical protein